MMISRRTAVSAIISATALPILGAGRAFAQKTIPLTIASSHPLTIPWVSPLKTVIVDKSNALLEQRGSEFRIDWTEAFGGTLYNFNETLEAVTSQLTDMGWIGSLFEPASLPLQNIMYMTPFATQTVAQAINTMNKLNAEQPAMKEEWSRYNITFFGSCVSDGYSLFTKKPIESLADLQGLKILGGATLAPWIEPLGASLVATGIPQMYSQTQTGVGDGVLLIATGAYPLKLHEVAPYVTRVDTGPLTFGGFGINTTTFESLPEDVQQVIAELGAEYSTENARLIVEREKQVFEAFAKEGATVTDMPQAQKQEWVDRLPDLGAIWAEATEATGAPAREIMKAFMETVRAEGAEPLRDWAANL
ncbi:C4-dicarboxylate TRAP transporter substrate-binding protein [Polymorphum gilvum]|uniref:TRAP-type C4-dicarboxylate transport system periplasmic component-like protein n=1 Tax=Polymorphum gilvum (strain LMG 25793 / CGMCC 1.9160 / SL003B-26A1) TaxID=991905 RepID=F2J2G4_POLGS|nr:C4-dicarboxylate TRAP transporter substrate-binding protein [Polymorphum gilvum]ADZ70879.1 TRAP-type C4-dicarboxylate transport system periplasmic component-like protein [Polymorphum gilvum SL003B-26A1]